MVKLVMMSFEAMTAMIRFMAVRAQTRSMVERVDTLDGGIDDDIIHVNLVMIPSQVVQVVMALWT